MYIPYLLKNQHGDMSTLKITSLSTWTTQHSKIKTELHMDEDLGSSDPKGAGAEHHFDHDSKNQFLLSWKIMSVREELSSGMLGKRL